MGPQIYVLESAIVDMADEVLTHPNIETAWGLYGVTYGEETALVTGVIRPNEEDVDRDYANVRQGGVHQQHVYEWLAMNFDQMYAPAQEPHDKAEFAFLFKGHSHHHLGLERYSGVDNRSIVSAVVDDGLKIAVGPLANINENRCAVRTQFDGRIMYEEINRVPIRFYYYSRVMADRGQSSPIVVTPMIIKKLKVSLSPPVGWQFARESLHNEELRLLQGYGCTITSRYVRPKKAETAYEIQFIVSHPDWGKNTLLITTPWDYPQSAPRFEILGKPSMVQPVWWKWGEHFIEVIWRLEAKGELRDDTTSS